MRKVDLTAEVGEGWEARWSFRCGGYWGVRRRADKRRVVSGRGGGIVLGLSRRKITVLSLRSNYRSCNRISSGLGSDVISTLTGSMQMQIVSLDALKCRRVFVNMVFIADQWCCRVDAAPAAWSNFIIGQIQTIPFFPPSSPLYPMPLLGCH